MCFFSYVQLNSCRYREGRELDLARVCFSQGSTIRLERGKEIEIVCRGEIKVTGYRVQDADRLSSRHNNFQVFLFLKYY